MLQEFDLRGSEVVIGRSGECHITIEDPLVSRMHARIVTDPSPLVEDLTSRNGVKVNGRKINGPTELRDGDRIRLGTQELVFTVVRSRRRELRPTGFMRNCHSCGTPYPEGADRCPHCGVATQAEEDETTISGLAMEPNRSWTFQLLGDVIKRAIESDRVVEADKLFHRAAGELEAQIRQGSPIDDGQLNNLSTLAFDLAAMQGKAHWVEWLIDVHRQLGACPSAEVVQRLDASGVIADAEMRVVLDGFVAWLEKQARSAGADSDWAARLAAIDGLRQR